MGEAQIQLKIGIPPEHRDDAARLYDEAFAEKFAIAIPDSNRRLQLLASSFSLEFAVCAFYGSKLIGLAGFQNLDGALTSGMTYRSLLSQLGFLRGNWAAMVLSLYERTPSVGELVMDGIAVRPDARGQGVGTALLEKLRDYAANTGFSKIRLDVVDTNPDARKLYERFGFAPARTEHFEYLRWFLGFGASTKMYLSLSSHETAPRN